MGVSSVILKIAKFFKNSKDGEVKSVGKFIADKTGYTQFAKDVTNRNTSNASFFEKISELKTDSNLSESYVADLIESAKSVKPLYVIREYLKSESNGLSKDITKKLLDAIGRKIYKFTKKFAEYFDYTDLY